jgi:hypothetical protein
VSDFKRGNSINIAFAGAALILWFVQKFYYMRKNKRRAESYAKLSEEDKSREDELAREKGNKSLTFRFTT